MKMYIYFKHRDLITKLDAYLEGFACKEFYAFSQSTKVRRVRKLRGGLNCNAISSKFISLTMSVHRHQPKEKEQHG